MKHSLNQENINELKISQLVCIITIPVLFCLPSQPSPCCCPAVMGESAIVATLDIFKQKNQLTTVVRWTRFWGASQKSHHPAQPKSLSANTCSEIPRSPLSALTTPTRKLILGYTRKTKGRSKSSGHSQT